MSSTIDRSAKPQVRPGTQEALAVAQRVGAQQVAEEIGAQAQALFDLWGGSSFSDPRGASALGERAKKFAEDAETSFASEPPRKVGGTKKKKDA